MKFGNYLELMMKLIKQGFISNKLLNSITFSNSSNEDSIGEYDDEIILTENIEKYLLDISSELFLFNYITKQFEKEKLIQIPGYYFFEIYIMIYLKISLL